MVDKYLRCPNCNKIMTLRERHNDGKLFYGCTNYPECNGTRNYEEGAGKETIDTRIGTFSNGFEGRCIKCEQYPSYGELSDMGLCPSCQEKFDSE